MARWRLLEAHYINTPGTEWEYKETSRDSGRTIRKTYPVPLYLDPKDPADWTEDGEIFVTREFNRAHPRDIIYLDPPTPAMEPVDEEAEAISDAERSKWINPIESINMSYSESRISEFERQIAELMAKNLTDTKPLPSVATGGVTKEMFDKLQEQVAQLMARNAELEAAVPKRRL